MWVEEGGALRVSIASPISGVVPLEPAALETPGRVFSGMRTPPQGLPLRLKTRESATGSLKCDISAGGNSG
jgi:hypothetical protein